jgi:hypothetical protein
MVEVDPALVAAAGAVRVREVVRVGEVLNSHRCSFVCSSASRTMCDTWWSVRS